MGTSSTKKKFSFWKLMLWIVVIIVALNTFSDGEFGDWLSSMLDGGSSYLPDDQQETGYLGVTLEEKNGITGGYISAVEPGGPGADAGLLPDDIIVSIGNSAVNSYDDVITELASRHVIDHKVKQEKMTK